MFVIELRRSDEVSDFENCIENSIVQLVFGRNSLTFNSYDDIIEETSEDDYQNSFVNDDPVSHSDNCTKTYDELHSAESNDVEFNDEMIRIDDLVEFSPG